MKIWDEVKQQQESIHRIHEWISVALRQDLITAVLLMVVFVLCCAQFLAMGMRMDELTKEVQQLKQQTSPLEKQETSLQ